MTDRAADAARWFAASRRGAMSIEERQAFMTWRSDPVNAHALAELELLWAEAGLLRAAAAQAAVRGDPSRAGAARFVATAAAILVLISVQSITSGPFWTALDWWSR